MISFYTENIKNPLKEKQKTKSWIKNIIQQKGRAVGEINYIFCDDDYLLTINKQYLNHDYYTDIITFDNSESSKKIDADIYISIDRVAENAKTHSETFEKELLRVIIHGILHLLGHKDKTGDDAKKMRALENSCLAEYSNF
jgi:probable rRNA maturation factor